jgi:4-hydroxy-2-oxoglutarate aldolase
MNLSGVLAPIPTPFDERGDVDVARLSAALTRWLATPLTGFVVLGTSGEAVLLDENESDRAIGAARNVVPRSRSFIVGTGRESTRATLAATRRAANLGADAVLVRTPGFFKTQMTAAAFVRHYTAVADDSPVPVLLYNFTAVTGVTLPVEAVTQLASHPNVIGMKESGGDILRLTDLAAAVSSTFTLLAGSVASFHAALRLGAGGGILALASVLPFACTRCSS